MVNEPKRITIPDDKLLLSELLLITKVEISNGTIELLVAFMDGRASPVAARMILNQ